MRKWTILIVFPPLLLIALPFGAIFNVASLAQANFNRFRLSGSEVYYNGAVAAEHPRCSEIGVQMLEAGGSAMDAAIAGLLCVGVVNNFSSGIGGGGFLLVRDAQGNAEVIDFRETAAESAHWDMFKHNITLVTESTLSSGVPGEIRGFALAHSQYGRLPWAKLFEPSIRLAHDGFPVNLKLEQMISKFANKLMKSTGMVEAYFRPDGTPKKIGDFIYRPNLARTLQKIATHGPEVFYAGEIGQHFVQTIQENEGGITMEDLRKYKAISRPALIGEFAGFKVITSGLPTCGPLILQILNVLEKSHFAGKLSDWKSAQKMVETFKFAYVDRMKMGDPDFISNPDEIVAKIISPQRAAQIAPRIHVNQTFPPKYYLEGEEFAQVENHGTTHLTAMDRDGMTVSATSTVNLEWGCKKMCPVTGIIINNEVDDFSIPDANNSFGLPPSHANFIAGGKRPLSSAAPVILEKDGKVFLALGGAGGSRIITAVAEMIIKLILYGMDPDDAMESCRLHHQLIPDAVLAEDRCDRELLKKLNTLGHTMIIMGKGQYAACINMVMGRDDGGMIPVSDSRKGGVAAGF